MLNNAVRCSLDSGHHSALCCAVFSFGRRAVTGGSDTLLRIWDLENKVSLGPPLEGHTASVLCVIAEADVIISGGTDATVRVWRLAACNQYLQSMLISHVGPVRCMSAIGTSQLLSGGSDGVVRVWCLETGRCLTLLEGHSGAVNCCSVLEVKTARCSRCDEEVRESLDSIEAHRCREAILETNESDDFRAESSDSPGMRLLALTGSSDETLRLWNLSSGKCCRVFTGHYESVTCCSLYAHQNRRVFSLSGSLDETLKVWEASLDDNDGDAQGCLHSLSGHMGGVTTCAVGKGVAVSGSFDSSVKLWDIPSN